MSFPVRLTLRTQVCPGTAKGSQTFFPCASLSGTLDRPHDNPPAVGGGGLPVFGVPGGPEDSAMLLHALRPSGLPERSNCWSMTVPYFRFSFLGSTQAQPLYPEVQHPPSFCTQRLWNLEPVNPLRCTEAVLQVGVLCWRSLAPFLDFPGHLEQERNQGGLCHVVWRLVICKVICILKCSETWVLNVCFYQIRGKKTQDPQSPMLSFLEKKKWSGIKICKQYVLYIWIFCFKIKTKKVFQNVYLGADVYYLNKMF